MPLAPCAEGLEGLRSQTKCAQVSLQPGAVLRKRQTIRSRILTLNHTVPCASVTTTNGNRRLVGDVTTNS
jgi:hypothetical protein